MKSISHFVCVALFAGFCTAVAQDAPPANPESASFSGKVVETMNASSYTYVLLDTGTSKVWAAAPKFEVKAGDSVDVTRGMEMRKYHSNSMNRDFEVIYFTGSVAVNGKPAGSTPPTPPPTAATLPPNHPPIPGAAKSPDGTAGGSPGMQLPKDHPPLPAGQLPKDHPPIGGAKPKPEDFSDIKKPEGGKTVSEIVTGRTELSGKDVAVRGKVVKYNSQVMGKNWLHIRDGSGSEGTNDLTITTANTAAVGDTVLVKGKVSTDRDFGAGYKYSVIIEEAAVTVE